MKKLINNSENVFKDVLTGLEAAYPECLKKLDKGIYNISRNRRRFDFYIKT